MFDASNIMNRQVRVLVGLIGVDDTFKLIKSCGGTTIKIPKKPNNSVLKKIIGNSADILCKEMYCQEILIPKHDKITQQIRNNLIKEDRKTMSLSKLAKKYDLTVRQIINICHPVSDTQTDLFNP
jgi:Mor family transcriptional regulator